MSSRKDRRSHAKINRRKGLPRRDRGPGPVAGAQQADADLDRQIQMVARAARHGPLGDVPVVISSPHHEKMSEVMAQFIEPYLTDSMTTDMVRRLVLMATAAWNAALFPEPKRSEIIDELFNSAFPPDPAIQREARAGMAVMIQRKLSYFRDNQRFIISCDVKGAGRDLNLVVMSTLNQMDPPEGRPGRPRR